MKLSYKHVVIIVCCNKLKVFMTNVRFSFSGPMNDRLPFHNGQMVVYRQFKSI